MEKTKPGEIIRIGDKLYSVCTRCKNFVQLNKRFFGSLHICDP